MTRKEAIQELRTRKGISGASTYSEAYLTAIDMACEALETLPVKGEWQRIRRHEYVCTECGVKVSAWPVPHGDFCDRCGADMRESVKAHNERERNGKD